METKICNKCGIEKILKNFNLEKIQIHIDMLAKNV